MALLDSTRLGNAGIIAATILVVALQCGPVAAQTAMKIIFDSRLGGPAAPFTLGIDEGHYATEELQVSIDADRNTAAALQHIAADPQGIGFVDINALIRFRDQNPQSRLKAVFVVYNRPAYAIVGRK